MAEVKFPQRVKRGSCRVTIYATPSKGRELYTLASERRTRSVTQQSAVARPTIRSASEDASINVMPNRGVTAENRRKNWSFLKARWGLKSAVPNDFNGIPTLNNMRCWLMPLAKDRHKEHVEHLWRVASLAADGSIEQVGAEAFDQCLNLPLVGMASLTIGLFWISPEKFLSADSKTTAYSKAKGITTEPEDYESYRRWLKEMTERLGNNFPQVSHEAHLFACQKRTEGGAKEKALAIHDAPLESRARQYWTLSAGAGGEHWKEFCEQGIAAIGWDGTPDLRGFKSKEELRHKRAQISF